MIALNECNTAVVLGPVVENGPLAKVIGLIIQTRRNTLC